MGARCSIHGPIVSDLLWRSMELLKTVRYQRARTASRALSDLLKQPQNSSEGKRSRHDEELVDPAISSPESWQKFDGVIDKLGSSKITRRFKTLIDLATCPDVISENHARS